MNLKAASMHVYGVHQYAIIARRPVLPYLRRNLPGLRRRVRKTSNGTLPGMCSCLSRMCRGMQANVRVNRLTILNSEAVPIRKDSLLKTTQLQTPAQAVIASVYFFSLSTVFSSKAMYSSAFLFAGSNSNTFSRYSIAFS
jgi:hypothetical protein